MSISRSRAPLANIPNATNSPHRSLVQSTKRPRTQVNGVQQENEPPQKRQMVERDAVSSQNATPKRKVPTSTAESRVFETGSANGEPTAFQRKLAAARDTGSGYKVTKNHDAGAPNSIDNIRQWQKHQRRAFPMFSFYFESIPEDVRKQFSRQVASLGAQEERFFSRAVTHIVTSRPIPPEPENGSLSGSSEEANSNGQLRTIDPMLLDKSAGSLPRTYPAGQPGPNPKKEGNANLDVLSRGRQMGMKIWSLDKCQRVLTSILEDSPAHAPNTRGGHVGLATARAREEDLSQVLQNERLKNPSGREANSSLHDVVLFKGPFIYIHDMDVKIRPIMVREYDRPAKRSEGTWPQFRSANIGKCPFIEDPVMKRELEREKEREGERALALQRQHETTQAQVHRTRSTTTVQAVKMDPPRRTSPRKALQEVNNVPNLKVALNAIAPPEKPFVPPRMEHQPSYPGSIDRASHLGFVRPGQMHFGGEPAASGIQRSNLTSAIQSQMISSTAAAPGGRAPTSKEVYELKRKVLERTNTGSLSVGSIPSSHRMTDLAGALKNARAPAPQRAAKSKAQEKLGGIQEERRPSDDDVAAERAAHAASRKTKASKKDLKPGYCENCRDKYEDFDEHIVSRKHRKFAVTPSNWTELDDLLRKLQAP